MSSVYSHQDKAVIKRASVFARLKKEWAVECKREFEKKGGCGLWWDAKGLWNSSDKDAVLEDMDKYKEIYTDVLACLDLVGKGDENPYERLLEIYEKLDEMEKDARCDADGNSKALCSVAREFLDHHWKLDHNLKRVECVVLKKMIRKMEEKVVNMSKKIDSANRNVEELRKDNNNLKISVDELHKGNADLKKDMGTLLEENKTLKVLILESNTDAERRCREIVEQNMRGNQAMIKEFWKKIIADLRNEYASCIF